MTFTAVSSPRRISAVAGITSLRAVPIGTRILAAARRGHVEDSLAGRSARICVDSRRASAAGSTVTLVASMVPIAGTSTGARVTFAALPATRTAASCRPPAGRRDRAPRSRRGRAPRLRPAPSSGGSRRRRAASAARHSCAPCRPGRPGACGIDGCVGGVVVRLGLVERGLADEVLVEQALGALQVQLRRRPAAHRPEPRRRARRPPGRRCRGCRCARATWPFFTGSPASTSIAVTAAGQSARRWSPAAPPR